MAIPSERTNELLGGVAADLLDCRTPLAHEFLVAHDVSYDECMGLSELASHVLRGCTFAPLLVQDNLLLAGVVANGDGLPHITGEDIFNASLQGPLPHAKPSKRMQSLLRHLALDFLEARETFSHEFLVTHDVSYDECMNLSEMAGHLLRGYMHAAKVIRDTVLVCGIAGKTIPGELVFSAGLQIDIQHKLKALNA